MAVKIGVILCTLFLGGLAVPVPEDDLSIFFPESRSSRIVGGSLAPDGAHPWMAAMSSGFFIRSFACGASVISPRTVLTAAHCITPFVSFGSLSSSLRVTVGTNRWNSGGQQHNLGGFIIHPNYDRNLIKNDVGALYTTNNIIFNDRVRAIPINFDFVSQGIDTRVAGWGAQISQGPSQAQLVELQATVIEGNRCINEAIEAAILMNVRAPPVDPTVEICTFRATGQGTCHGDSGSALVRIDRGQQIGVVSWGFPCARGAPDMFVRLSAFQSWINQITRN